MTELNNLNLEKQMNVYLRELVPLLTSLLVILQNAGEEKLDSLAELTSCLEQIILGLNTSIEVERQTQLELKSQREALEAVRISQSQLLRLWRETENKRNEDSKILASLLKVLEGDL